MPTASDLVTDLPADFETFGQAVATSLADLLGGTTGQVLKKNSNTDMDFVWAADSAGMTNPMTTTGDTIYSSSGSTPARLGIGTSGQVMTVSGAGIPSWTTLASGVGNASSTINTLEVTTSTSYTNLATTQSVTLTTGTKVLVLISCGIQTDSTSKRAFVSYDISGATTQSASDAQALIFERPGSGGGQTNRFAIHSFATVTAGSNTFTLKFKAQTPAEAQFEYRTLTVLNLGS
jgi:hypothetical protein